MVAANYVIFVACWQQFLLGYLDKGWDGEEWDGIEGMGRVGVGRLVLRGREGKGWEIST